MDPVMVWTHKDKIEREGMLVKNRRMAQVVVDVVNKHIENVYR